MIDKADTKLGQADYFRQRSLLIGSATFDDLVSSLNGIISSRFDSLLWHLDHSCASVCTNILRIEFIAVLFLGWPHYSKAIGDTEPKCKYSENEQIVCTTSRKNRPLTYNQSNRINDWECDTCNEKWEGTCPVLYHSVFIRLYSISKCLALSLSISVCTFSCRDEHRTSGQPWDQTDIQRERAVTQVTTQNR
jgi:hypothetical protein